MPLQQTIPPPVLDGFTAPNGTSQIELHEPNLVVLTFRSAEATKADVDLFMPELERIRARAIRSLQLVDMRESNDVSIEVRWYIAQRLKVTPSRPSVLAVAFVTNKIYQRVILAGVFALSPPPHPYLVCTDEAEALAFLATHQSIAADWAGR